MNAVVCFGSKPQNVGRNCNGPTEEIPCRVSSDLHESRNELALSEVLSETVAADAVTGGRTEDPMDLYCKLVL